MGLAMQACAAAGKEFVVLDRPNPLGGLRVEGPPLNPSWRSFVGQYDVPYVHGLTPGEMARWVNRSSWMGKPCQLTVVPLRGWTRNMIWSDTGLSWVKTSPNIPSPICCFHYVATGGLGEARSGFEMGLGTSESFGYACARWLDANRYAEAMNRVGIEGVAFDPAHIDGAPGVRIRYTNPHTVKLCTVATYLMTVAQRQKGKCIFVGKSFEMFDKCSGGPATRVAITKGASAKDLLAAWAPSVERFRGARASILLYE
jgi:uncharacterized protein YbbC (DUF1343 family)